MGNLESGATNPYDLIDKDQVPEMPEMPITNYSPKDFQTETAPTPDYGSEDTGGLSSDFMDTYGSMNEMGSPSPYDSADVGTGEASPSDYYNPEGVNEYINQASKPSEAQALLKQYAESRPKEADFKPGFWRTLGGSLLGLAASNFGRDLGAAGRISSMIFNEPYAQASENWKKEGETVSARARALQSDEVRELGARKFGLQQEATATQRAAQEERDRRTNDRLDRAARGQAEDRDLSRENLKAWRDSQNTLARERLEEAKARDLVNKNNILADNARAEQIRKDKAEANAAKDSSLEGIHKNLALHASRVGIDTSDMTDLDVAKQLAYQKAKASNAFADLLEQDAGGNWKLIEPKYGKDRIRILENHIKFLTDKYLKGQF